MLKLKLILDSFLNGLMLAIVIVFIIVTLLLERYDLALTLCVSSLIMLIYDDFPKNKQ